MIVNWRAVGLRQPGTNSVVFRLTIGRCVGTPDSAPFRRVRCTSEHREREYAGLRDAQLGRPDLDQGSMYFFATKLPCKLLGGSTVAEANGQHHGCPAFPAIEPGRLALVEIEPLAH
jgi:hypothetical protein